MAAIHEDSVETAAPILKRAEEEGQCQQGRTVEQELRRVLAAIEAELGKCLPTKLHDLRRG
ncbi:unnamed protein product [Ranitomeya imitator]|uniref:Uncharacterized protein n=1 Tax=Ranitomeya imitator TaxID=111125 RepID=A0ABN9MHI0_9NEOB|nr:unnamed protein product [Ranitomeya imitator]